MAVLTPSQSAVVELDRRSAASNAAIRQQRADFSERALENPEQLGEIVAGFVTYNREQSVSLGAALKAALHHVPHGTDGGIALRLLVQAALADKASEEIQ